MTSLTEINSREFSEQYRRLAIVDNSRIVLAGGNDPVTGRRSQFSAELRCVDIDSCSTIWNQSLPRNHPFSQPVVNREFVGVALEFNFAREPTGLFLFAKGDGSPDRKQIVSGLKGLTAFPKTGAFVYSFEQNGSFHITLNWDDGRKSTLRLPYATAGLSLCDIQSLSEEDFVLAIRRGNSCTFERWSLSQPNPIWVCKSKNNRCVLRNDRLITFSTDEGFCSIGEITQDEGVESSVANIRGAGISNLFLLDDQTVFWINHDRQVGISKFGSKKGHHLVQLDAKCPGWTDLALLPNPNRIVTLNANNHSDPKAELKLFIVN